MILVAVSGWKLRLSRCKIPPSLQEYGDVAQLGERRVRNAKVGSSILLVSTKIQEAGCSSGLLNLIRASCYFQILHNPSNQSTIVSTRCRRAILSVSVPLR